MKILVIHTSYKQQGGEDVVVANEVELLRSIGEEVEILHFSNTGHSLLKLLQLPFNYGVYRQTLKKVDTFKPDIVHIHNLHFGASASVIYALKKSEIPFVVTLHNYRLLCPSATLFYDGKLFLDATNRNFSWKAVFKGVYQNSSLLTFWVSFVMLIHELLGTWKLPVRYIVLGQQTKDIFQRSKLREIVPKMIIKPNFCYSDSSLIQFKRKYYLYLGRLSEEKGIALLLQAFAANGLPLRIAGAGPMKDEVKKYAGQYPNIDFIGKANKQQAAELVSGAEALIFPSLWHEPFGMVIIEAFAAGTPVIASDIGEAKYLIKNQYSGLHFKTGSLIDLQKKLSFFRQLPEQEKMGYQNNALITYRENYSPEQNATQLLSVYSQAIVQSN